MAVQLSPRDDAALDRVARGSAAALRRAEQLRSNIEDIVVRYLEKNLPRIGVAVFPDAGDNPQAVLKAADQALYRAKERAATASNCPAPRQWTPTCRSCTPWKCTAYWPAASTFRLRNRTNRLHHSPTLEQCRARAAVSGHMAARIIITAGGVARRALAVQP